MSEHCDHAVVATIARRTFLQAVESPIFYVVAFFFFGFLGSLFGMDYFATGLVSVTSLIASAPWILWFVVPALTMGLFADELRSGTFESLATLPIRDHEIVIGKFLGFAVQAAILIGAMIVYPIIIAPTALPGSGVEWGATIGGLAGLYFVSLAFGAMGLFASSLTKSNVVALIGGMMFCTFFFFSGHYASAFPGPIAAAFDFLGVSSHLDTLGRGVWDFRDLFYFASVIAIFLFLTVQRLLTRRA